MSMSLNASSANELISPDIYVIISLEDWRTPEYYSSDITDCDVYEIMWQINEILSNRQDFSRDLARILAISFPIIYFLLTSLYAR